MSAASRVLSLSRNRQIVKRFADRPVPPKLIERILECARFAPSAGERQPWRFIVVQDALLRHQLAAAAFHNPLVRTAPLLLIGCARISSHISGSGHPSHPTDLAAATQSAALAAADLGLATAWITGYREAAVRELVGIPADVPVVTVLAIGYSDGFTKLPERRPMEETVHWDGWKRS